MPASVKPPQPQGRDILPPGRRKFVGLGPGLLVAAAFVGPGTVTTASQAGAGFGVALLWAVVFATVATILLQEMAARLGLVARQGLGEVVRGGTANPLLRWLACGLIVVAIFFGNAAYQTGNLMGTALGLELMTGLRPVVWVVVVGFIAGGLLWSGMYKLIERVLVALVVTMSLVFLATAVLVRPDIGSLVRGLCVPAIPPGALIVVLGLVGTTVVPYNLFLHASAVQQRWPASLPVGDALAASRLDTILSIGLGGMVTMAIVVTGAAAESGGRIATAADMARQLEPLLGGRAAPVLFAVGLFAAGMTSAITAPLAAAYATAGAMGWPSDLKSWRFRVVWLLVLATGMVLALVFGRSPTQAILVAQVANGLLLPVIATFLLAAVNRSSLMGKYRNRVLTNVLGVCVVLVTVALGGYTVWSKLGGW